MKQNINLSLGRKRVNKALRKIFIISLSFFCITVFISILLIAYRLILKNSYDALDQREQQLNSKLLALQEKEDKFIETRSRLADIKKVISTRSPVTTRINTISEFIPTDSEVTGIGGNDASLQLGLESSDLASLNELIEQKIEAIASDKKQGVQKVEMSSFSLNPKTLKYIISFTVYFQGK